MVNNEKNIYSDMVEVDNINYISHLPSEYIEYQ